MLMFQFIRALATVLLCSTFQSGTATGPRLTVRDVVENVLSNEALYDRLEVDVVRSYTLDKPSLSSPDLIKQSRESIRSVAQDGMLYHNSVSQRSDVNGRNEDVSTIYGYDGDQTRVVQKDHANIYEDKKLFHAYFHPHRVLFWSGTQSCPLSIFLQGGAAIRAADCDAGSENPSDDLRVALLGVEEDGSLRLIKLRCDYVPKNPKFASYYVIWLSAERNYLPVRKEYYFPYYSPSLPTTTARVEEFKEISPNLWLPIRVKIDTYNPRELRKGNMVVANSETITVTRCNPNPQYDISLFRDIKIPDGLPVYVVGKNKKISKSFYQGGKRSPNWQRPQAAWPWPWIGLACVMVPAALFGYRWWRARPGVRTP